MRFYHRLHHYKIINRSAKEHTCCYCNKIIEKDETYCHEKISHRCFYKVKKYHFGCLHEHLKICADKNINKILKIR